MASPTTGGGNSEECHKGPTSGIFVKARPRSSEHWTLALQFVNFFVVYPRVKPIIMTQPLNETFTALLLYYFVYPKYVLLRLLKFLLIKRTLNYLFVIISYFICDWKG